MRRRPIPVRPPHQRSRVRISLAALLLPFLAILVQLGMEPSRRPLEEREAVLAIDVQRLRRGAEAIGTATHGPWTATTLSLVAGTPRLVGNRELQLRLPGILAGAAAIGALTLLGRRMFVPRVGIATALLMLAVPSARQLIGFGLGGEPFFVLAMSVALLAIREMALARGAAVVAGLAGGVACAVAGVDGLWLPLLALVWLRLHRGLTFRSAGVVVGTTGGVAAVLLVVGWLAFGRDAGLPLLPEGYGPYGYLDPTLVRPRPTGMQLLPLAPLVLLGAFSMRSAWWRSESFQLLLLWLVLAGATWVVTGTAAGALTAILMTAAAIALLALEHTRRLIAVPACAIALGLAFEMNRAAPQGNESQILERWAIRETGRFVGRVIDPGRTIAADARAARRLAYYGNRRIELLPAGTSPATEVDYVVVPRDEFRSLRETHGSAAEASSDHLEARVRRVAEFGGWVVARVSEGPAERTVNRSRNSSFVRPR